MPTETFWLQNPLPIPMVFTSYFNSLRDYGKHEGIDLAATDQSGNPVKVLAAQSGMVVKVGYYAAGYGHYIVIRHAWTDGEVYVTWYGHLSQSSVHTGDYVSIGDQIGVAGNSGNSTGIHLHLTLQHIGKGLSGYVVPDVVDPRPFFKSSPPAYKQLMFVADETIPDGMILKPGTSFVKTWRIANSGTLDWQTGDALILQSGELMGASVSYPLPELKRGEQGSISIPMEAPATQGVHRGVWKARSAQGQFFDFPLWVEIITAGAAADDHALFLEDVAIPDGTEVQPGQTFLKSWKVRNTGSSAWRNGYQLVYSDDDRMDAPESIPVPYTRSGEEAVLSISLKAPQSNGDFRSTWRLRNPAGEFFGPPLWAQVHVKGSGQQIKNPGLQFIADISLPSGSRLNPNQEIQKTWRVMKGYKLALIGGEVPGAPAHVDLPETSPGEIIDISLNLVTPAVAGQYTAKWRPQDDQGRFFGEDLLLQFEVATVLHAGQKLDDSQFVKDVTIMDGSSISAGSKFLKTWRVRNSGASTWSAGYFLDYYQDERLDGQAVPLTFTPPGGFLDISVELTAPLASGSHRSTWRIRNPQGDFFGHEYYTIIQVPAATASAPDNRAKFMGHETIELWETLPPGQPFEKIWLVRNLGRSAWVNGYTLAFLEGDVMSSPESVSIPYAETMMTVKVSVNLIAPPAPGYYRGYWKLRDPAGKLFGPRLPVWIRVK